MDKKIFRSTVLQNEAAPSLAGQPMRDATALILPISSIRLGKNIREELGNLDELAESVRQNGVLQPVLVAKLNGALELVAGFRRIEAAKRAGLAEIPVRILRLDENQVVIVRLIENLQREELSGWETCKAIHALTTLFDSQAKIANAIKKDKGYVSKCIAVVRSKPEVERVQHLPLRELFRELGKKHAAVEKNVVGRKLSGPIPGGRYNSRAIQFRENPKTKAFSLRVNYHPDRSPAAVREVLIEKLRELINRLTSI